ncbi:PDR/VanB family oxidoreductase [Streptomyces sp. RS10V-4]|uniref:PDR/VanB family oxidoreductase n=1 Tax=Streptomyces rhizoryzae TaxID=2932493 RepID=UPI0020067EC4|nr:PDR/VanB family oxidoreductase [Streptomyces rhizoryzae]MCK7621724.1 PDR/VanB family oxidoreductase [Streptomyces rhizoryzae]
MPSSAATPAAPTQSASGRQPAADREHGAPSSGFDVTVRQLRWEADGVVSLQLAKAGGGPLPPWEPGAHVDLVLPTGIQRQYSLCGPTGDVASYRIGVRRERAGRGGSEYVHAFLRPGQRLHLKGPRNNFGFRPAASYVFVAGGIGITPILPMIRQAETQGTPWRLLYGGHTAASMPFLDELRHYGSRVGLYPADTVGRAPLGSLFAQVEPGAKIYACGPAPLLSALGEAVAHWPRDTLHVERFTARRPRTPADDKPVDVVCRASGRTVAVPAGRSILDGLEEAGIRVPASCRSGLCGSCETTVLEGVPDHRDEILSAEERDVGDRMFVCVSRARTPRLVLGL